MTKQEEFLYIVQTSILANAINLSLDPEQIDKYRHEISLTGVFNLSQDAIEASKMIPDEMPAAEAANQWITYFVDSQKKGEPEEVHCPVWCHK